MRRKSKIVLLMLALTITVGMTAVTATLDLDGSVGTGDVDVDRSPLVVEDVNGTPASNVTTDIVEDATGTDRVSVSLDSALADGDEVQLEVDLRNTADEAVGVEVRTNTSSAVELVDYGPTTPGPSTVALALQTGIADQPARFTFTLDPQGGMNDTATVMLTYEVVDGTEVGGPFDLDLFVEMAD